MTNPKYRFEKTSANYEADGSIYGILFDGIEKDVLHKFDKLLDKNHSQQIKYKGISVLCQSLIDSINKTPLPEIKISNEKELKNIFRKPNSQI